MSQNFDHIITYNRIKQTLKNIIKDNFLTQHHIHPSDHQKAIEAAQKHLTAYCNHVLNDPHICKILRDRITLDTYDISPELQESFSKDIFKDKLTAKIDNIWPQLRELSLEDWAEFSPKAAAHTANKTIFQRIRAWL